MNISLTSFATIFVVALIANLGYAQTSNPDFSYFPEGYYSSIAYTDMKFIDQLNVIAGEAMPQIRRELYLKHLPNIFSITALNSLLLKEGEKDFQGFVVQSEDPDSATIKARRKKLIVDTSHRIEGKIIYQFLTEKDRKGDRTKFFFLIWDDTNIVGASDISFLNQMIETKLSSSSNVLSGTYYREFAKMLPELGGQIFAKFNEENVLDAVEKDFQENRISKESYDKWKLNAHLAVKYQIFEDSIDDNLFKSRMINCYSDEEGAQNSFNSYKDRSDDGVTKYVADKNKLIMTTQYTPQYLLQLKQQRLKWEAEEKRKKARKKAKEQKDQ